MGVGARVGCGAAVGLGVGVGTGVSVGIGVVVGSGVGAIVAVGDCSATGSHVGEGRTSGAGVGVGGGVLVGMTAAADTGVLTGTGPTVGMRVDSMIGMGSCEATDKSVSPAALPRLTNTAAMVTADTIGQRGLRERNGEGLIVDVV